jgi:uncharacterized protein (DUF2141 family)
VLAALSLLGLLHAGASPEVATGTIGVVVRGLHSSDGSVLFVLFDSRDGFPGDDAAAVRRAKEPIRAGISKTVWRDVPHGTYAIAVVHDENDNGAIDTNWLGMPREGYGASNNARGVLGPPRWRDARFSHDQTATAQVIKIVYL